MHKMNLREKLKSIPRTKHREAPRVRLNKGIQNAQNEFAGKIKISSAYKAS